MNPDHLTDDVEILYNLRKHGWSDLYILVEGKIYEVGITHIFGDPLGDLIRMCIALLDGEAEHEVALPNEPGTVSIQLSRYPRRRDVVAVRIKDQSGTRDSDNGTVIVSFDIKVHHLVGQFYHQFDKLTSLCRDAGYRKDRMPVPEREFLKLQLMWTNWLSGARRKKGVLEE